MSLKMLREGLCRRQVQADQWPSNIQSAVDVLINMIDRHRPLGSDGTHGDRHTPTCGCEVATTAPARPSQDAAGDAGEVCNCGWGGVHDPDNPRCQRNSGDAGRET